MYNLIEQIIGAPANYANSSYVYICGTILILFTVIMIDLIYKFIRHIIKSIERR